MERIKNITDDHGKPLKTEVYLRDDLCFGDYAQYGPDGFVSFDEYRWNTSESVGYGKIFEKPDSEGHGRYGYFCLFGSNIQAKGELKGISVLNVAPSVLDILNLGIPQDMEKPSILKMAGEKGSPSSPDREKTVRSRLEALGY